MESRTTTSGASRMIGCLTGLMTAILIRVSISAPWNMAIMPQRSSMLSSAVPHRFTIRIHSPMRKILTRDRWSGPAVYGQVDQVFTHADFNGDGNVGPDDFNHLSINYGTSLLVVWILADLHGGDFDVDDSDLLVILSNMGTGTTWEEGDLNGDGEVTTEDFDLALAQFGLDLEIVG